tara:strand:+ start:16333 stop:16653 length:321 start_codon:yes stop_codon:yes gene_type:complete
MTPEEQRIALAEALGWKKRRPEVDNSQWIAPQGGAWNNPPDYLNDLNAMHKAVETLFESSLYQDYWPMLDSIAQRDGNRGSSGRIAHTTAKQQAEAFLCVRNRDKS